MSKKINLSLKNNELSELSNLSEKTGKKVVEIIRDRYERGKNHEIFEKKFDEINIQLKLLKKENELKYSLIIKILESICNQNVFSNEVLSAILKGNKNEIEIKIFNESVDKKSKELMRKLRIMYLEN